MLGSAFQLVIYLLFANGQVWHQVYGGYSHTACEQEQQAIKAWAQRDPAIVLINIQCERL